MYSGNNVSRTQYSLFRTATSSLVKHYFAGLEQHRRKDWGWREEYVQISSRLRRQSRQSKYLCAYMSRELHAGSIGQELHAYMHMYVKHQTKKGLGTSYCGFCVYKPWLLHWSCFFLPLCCDFGRAICLLHCCQICAAVGGRFACGLGWRQAN